MTEKEGEYVYVWRGRGRARMRWGLGKGRLVRERELSHLDTPRHAYLFGVSIGDNEIYFAIASDVKCQGIHPAVATGVVAERGVVSEAEVTDGYRCLNGSSQRESWCEPREENCILHPRSRLPHACALCARACACVAYLVSTGIPFLGIFLRYT